MIYRFKWHFLKYPLAFRHKEFIDQSILPKKCMEIFKKNKVTCLVEPLYKFQFLNGPNFCRVLKSKTSFLNIPKLPPPSAVQNLLTSQFYQKNLSLWKFSKKFTSINRNIHPGDSWPYICLYNEYLRRKTIWRNNLGKEV